MFVELEPPKVDPARNGMHRQLLYDALHFGMGERKLCARKTVCNEVITLFGNDFILCTYAGLRKLLYQNRHWWHRPGLGCLLLGYFRWTTAK